MIIRGLVFQNGSWKPVDKKSSCLNTLNPEGQRDLGGVGAFSPLPYSVVVFPHSKTDVSPFYQPKNQPSIAPWHCQI